MNPTTRLLLFSFTTAISFALLSPDTEAQGLVEGTKEYANKAMFWKGAHLKEISFQSLFPKALYKKSYFSWLILATSIGIGATVTYVTAGAGAPVAATGVSTVASWIVGGGAGSYMGGLSAVGSVVGGNAIIGAAILNGLSFGIIGGTTGGFATLSTTAKFCVIANVSATLLDGVATLDKHDAGMLHYTAKLKVPKGLGGKSVRQLVEEIYENEERKADAANHHDTKAMERYADLGQALLKSSTGMLKDGLEKESLSQEDLLVLGIINYSGGSVELFQKAIEKLTLLKPSLDKMSYIDYLSSISLLLDVRESDALASLDRCLEEEPYAVEAAILKLNILANDLGRNEQSLLDTLSKLERSINSNRYSSEYSLLAPYFRVASVYYRNGNYDKAKVFFEKAGEQIGILEGFLGGAKVKTQARLGAINCGYLLGETQKAEKDFTTLIKSMKPEEGKELKGQYVGTQSLN